MYKCEKCDKSFTRDTNLMRHARCHDETNFPCSSCSKVFTRRDNLIRHSKETHHSNILLHQQQHPYTSNITKHEIEDFLKPSENVYYDYEAHSNLKRVHHVENLNTAVNAKKSRMLLAQTPGFVEIGSSHRKKIEWYYKKNTSNFSNYNDFLQSSKEDLFKLLKSHSSNNPIKYNLKLEATYNRPHIDNSAENRAFKTSAKELFMDTNIKAKIDLDFANLMSEEDIYTGKGSGFSLQSIDGLLLGVYKYTPMGGSSYISLPNDIKNKKAVINVQNTDQQCFKWALLTKYVDNVHSLVQFTSEEHRYDFTGLTFPTPLHEVKIFERNNPNVSINVYGLKHQKNKKHNVYPLKVVDKEKTDHFDLLLITDGDKSHYTYISNFSRLVRSQKTNHNNRVYICKRCFTAFDNQPRKHILNGLEALEEHHEICGQHKPVLPQMSPPGTMLKFDGWCKTQRHPIVIYADFEALLVKCEENKGRNTTAFQTHKPMSFGIKVVASNEVPIKLLEKFDIPQSVVIYRGSKTREEVAKQFVNSLVEIAGKVEKLFKTNVPITMKNEEKSRHSECTKCNLCKTRFTDFNHKVADHMHFSGKFRQTLCNTCNVKLQIPNFIPCFLHNLSNYDSHFIVTELGYDTNSITVIPNSEEKFISFSKYVTNNFTIRFVDTFRFMSSSLSTLASNLISPNLSAFRETAKHFTSKDMTLVTRKGVYPYEYTDNWEKLEERTLPHKNEFYSTLTETGVTEEDYDHTKNVWKHFNCKNLGEYSDLYLKIDVLLLADVFENFRDMCILTYNLDPVFYYTAPGFSFDCMLKYTNIKLELLTDYDIHLFFENAIRGGLTQASMRYAKANNENMVNYDVTKTKSWLVYQDCNNLYGWAMSQYMPYGGFKWVEPTLDGLETLSDTSDIGRVYEVDVSYPQHLHDEHNDLPFLPENKIPNGSNVQKLMATLESKKNYIIHYRNLQQAITNGLIIEKVHRVLEFHQSDWLAKYITLNTEMRKKAANNFEKDFFKLLNNAVFGKTMESMRKRIKMELVSCPKRLQKLINKPIFKHATKYHENLSAISLENQVIHFCKPIYIGFAVLDVSKSLMYDYHYNTMKRHFGDNLRLMYTDTDSLVYNIITDDFYNDLLNKPGLIECMDTSNLPHKHPCYTNARKKIPGLFSDETDGRIMTEFIALRAKSYAYILDNKEKIKAKGIRGHVVKNHMSFNDHMNCLFADDKEDSFNPYRENVSIRSFNHEIQTIKSNKLSFNRQDDKRVVQIDRIHTLAHGHYKI